MSISVVSFFSVYPLIYPPALWDDLLELVERKWPVFQVTAYPRDGKF